MAEYINIDSSEDRDKPGRLVTLNLTHMNLGEHIMFLAEAVADCKTLSVIQLSENSVEEKIIVEFCSALGINRDLQRHVFTKRHQVRAVTPLYKDLAQLIDDQMTNKVRIVNNHYLKRLQDQKKRVKLDEFQGLRHAHEVATQNLVFQRWLG